jgi:hypothetical protein
MQLYTGLVMILRRRRIHSALPLYIGIMGLAGAI